MSEPKVKKIKLSELIPDPQNANKGTERGRYMLEHSISTLGAGRSVLVDRNNVLIAGNKTTETAVESGFENAIVVETDGSELVVVRRTDLDITTDSRAKQLAIADNRTGEINLNFDPVVLADIANDVDLSGFFNDEEFKLILDEAGTELTGQGTEPEAPEEFKEYDENIETDHTCPKCGYKFSGGK
jgi:hypothetical protein